MSNADDRKGLRFAELARPLELCIQNLRQGNIPEFITDRVLDGVLANSEKGRWHARRILFVTGPHASGKSAVVRVALSGKEYALFDTGPILRNYHRTDAPNMTFTDWVKTREREYGEIFTDELLACHIQAAIWGGTTHPSGIVIIGNRSCNGVDYLSRRLTPSGSKVIYIDAPKEALYKRYKTREKKNITTTQFEAILEADLQMGLSELMQKADKKISNADELTSTAQQLRRYLDDWIPLGN